MMHEPEYVAYHLFWSEGFLGSVVFEPCCRSFSRFSFWCFWLSCIDSVVLCCCILLSFASTTHHSLIVIVLLVNKILQFKHKKGIQASYMFMILMDGV